MTWIAAGIGGATAIVGGIQAYQGSQNQKNNKRPSYQIPGEIGQNLSQAQQQSLQGLPEEQKQQFINNLQRGSAYGLSQLGSRSSGLGGVASMNQNQNDAYGNLLSKDAQARQQNQAALMNQRQVSADYKDKAFQLNQENPYYEKTAQNQAMLGAGMQNISGGLQLAGGGLMGFGKRPKPLVDENGINTQTGEIAQ